MLINWIRTIYSDNGVLTDKSLQAQNGQGVDAVMVANEDYIYFGQTYPFNNLYVKVDTANTNASVMSVQYWGPNAWYSAVNVLDDTAVSGKTLAQNGIIQWTPNLNYKFQEIKDTSEAGGPSELTSMSIYNMYWVRFKVSSNLSAGTKINKITYAFTNDSAITAIDPDINEYLGNWATGKTNWVDQIIIASNNVIVDLKCKGLIVNPAQILKMDELYLATAYKTLALIYNGLGDKFIQKRDFANTQYAAIINSIGITVDRNNNAIPEEDEQSTRKGYVNR